MKPRRVNLKAILADQDLRRELMVPTIQALQAREGIETTRDQAERAYYVVNEADKVAFFDLERFRGGKRSEPDRREEMFVRALIEAPERIRFNVAKQDFRSVEGNPLTYQNIGIVAPLVKENLSISHASEIQHGLSTKDDKRFVRMRWEVPDAQIGGESSDFATRRWGQFAKGGDFARFYFDSYLLVEAWQDFSRIKLSLDNKYPYLKGNYSWVLHPENNYLQEGLTYSRRSQKGFSVRYLPPSRFFSDKGPTVFPSDHHDLWPLNGFLNSSLVTFILSSITSFGSYEVGAVRRLPIADRLSKSGLGPQSKTIHDAKATWDEGNETSTRFSNPWLLRDELTTLAVPDRLDHLAELEATEESRIQQVYAELNDEVYKLYGIPESTRTIIEETLGERPPEILWPQMERKTVEQKRMEHVWRLLSYVVGRVVVADEDGVVPFMAAGGETTLIDRVRSELATLFPDHDINQVEVDITNELKRKIKGYRSVESIREWLDDIFFDYHVSLYKKRPVLWHIASSQGRGVCAVGALCHYHKFDCDRLAKLRGSYLRDAIGHFRREAGLADREGRTEDRQEWQAKLEEAQALDQRLQWVQEGVKGHPAPGDCRIRTPWKSEDELPDGWQPDLDDGVAVNILPLQTAGVLRIPKVV